MGFDIHLRKPDGREDVSNRVWLDLIVARLPGFRQDDADQEAMANDIATDTGLSVQEIVGRGIGLMAIHESADFWMHVGFWNDGAVIELPNFPSGGINDALARTRPLLALLGDAGFNLVDDDGSDVAVEDQLDALTSAYARRQAQVGRVAELLNGKPS